MAVLTISGQAGSRAPEIGRLAAKQLQFDYVDREILVEAAKTLGVPMESVAPFDERTASLGERLASMLRRFLERSAVAGAADPMLGSGGLDILLGRTYSEAAASGDLQEVSDESYFSTLTDVIHDLATNDNVVIIGRGSQVILKDWPAAVHVLLVGPLEHRIRQLALRDGLEEEEASKRVHDGDKGRAAFHQKFFKVEVDDPALYHLTLNTGRFTPEETALMISELTQRVAAQG
jgi:cytidylate kinase